MLPGNQCQRGGGGGRVWHKASVFGCLRLAAPIGLSPSHMLTLWGSARGLIVSTEPPDDLSCLTTPGVGRPGDGAVARAGDQGHPDAHPESMRGFADSSTDLCALGEGHLPNGLSLGEGGVGSLTSPGRPTDLPTSEQSSGGGGG